MKAAQPEGTMGAAGDLMVDAMLREMPIRAVLSFTGDAIMTYDELVRMIEELNEMNNK